MKNVVAKMMSDYELLFSPGEYGVSLNLVGDQNYHTIAGVVWDVEEDKLAIRLYPGDWPDDTILTIGNNTYTIRDLFERKL